MPNIFALLVLYSWPVLAFLLYWRLPVQRAFIWTILLGYLFMPPASAAFDLPALPEFTKLEIAALSATIMAIAFHGIGIIRLPRSKVVLTLASMYVLAPVFTVLTNGDTVTFGLIQLAPLSPIEIPAQVIGHTINLIPFFMAYSLFHNFDHLSDILIALVIAVLAYSLLILFEVRFSPQLNIWVYGFFQHSFIQMVRGGGFRPIVFLYHALWVGMLTVMAVVAAIALYKNNKHKASSPFAFAPDAMFRTFFRHDPRLVYLYLGLYFVFILVVSKSMGPILFGTALLVLLLAFTVQAQLWIAALLATIVLAYPLLRGLEVFPTELFVTLAESVSSDRGNSLAFRFLNEDILLERASERILFGWGAGARHLILDPTFGSILTIPDGQWIITLGVYGLVGFIGQMGILLYPVFTALYWRKVSDPSVISPYVPAMALLLSMNAVDMLPNATLTPITLLIAGAFWRHLEGIPERLKTAVGVKTDPMFGGVILPYDVEVSKKRTIL